MDIMPSLAVHSDAQTLKRSRVLGVTLIMKDPWDVDTNVFRVNRTQYGDITSAGPDGRSIQADSFRR